MKKTTTLKQPRKTTTTWTSVYETEVNGQPTLAKVLEEQTEEGAYEVNKTTITVGKTTRTRYAIDRRQLESWIDETATEEEDRIDKYGDLPF